MFKFICHVYYGKLNFVLQFLEKKMFKFFFKMNGKFSNIKKFQKKFEEVYIIVGWTGNGNYYKKIEYDVFFS